MSSPAWIESHMLALCQAVLFSTENARENPAFDGKGIDL